MKLIIKEGSTNYACSVVEIKDLFPIEGADNVLRVVVNGNNVVVPKSTEIGSKMLYFPSGCKLSEDYCKNNSLYDKEEYNLDNTKKGFISFKNRRIKCLRLRGVVSDGMLMPIESLNYIENDK
jgi:tRNA-binding EMAP/Myf-like protein